MLLLRFDVAVLVDLRQLEVGEREVLVYRKRPLVLAHGLHVAPFRGEPPTVGVVSPCLGIRRHHLRHAHARLRCILRILLQLLAYAVGHAVERVEDGALSRSALACREQRVVVREVDRAQLDFIVPSEVAHRRQEQGIGLRLDRREARKRFVDSRR